MSFSPKVSHDTVYVYTYSPLIHLCNVAASPQTKCELKKSKSEKAMEKPIDSISKNKDFLNMKMKDGRDRIGETEERRQGA